MTCTRVLLGIGVLWALALVFVLALARAASDADDAMEAFDEPQSHVTLRPPPPYDQDEPA